MTISPLTLNSGATFTSDVMEITGARSIEDAQEQFEGVFLSMLLKEMRKTVGEGIFGGDAADTIGGLFDLTLGEALGQNGGLGITQSLARYQRTSSLGQ